MFKLNVAHGLLNAISALENDWFYEPANDTVILEVTERAAVYNYDHFLLRLRPYCVSGTVFCPLYHLSLIIIYEKLIHYMHKKPYRLANNFFIYIISKPGEFLLESWEVSIIWVNFYTCKYKCSV